MKYQVITDGLTVVSHKVFSDVERAKEAVEACYGTAGYWHEVPDDLGNALEYALAAGDVEASIRRIQ
jgi:hypothetical protein